VASSTILKANGMSRDGPAQGIAVQRSRATYAAMPRATLATTTIMPEIVSRGRFMP